jgi:hypothetical protein
LCHNELSLIDPKLIESFPCIYIVSMTDLYYYFEVGLLIFCIIYFQIIFVFCPYLFFIHFILINSLFFCYPFLNTYSFEINYRNHELQKAQKRRRINQLRYQQKEHPEMQTCLCWRPRSRQKFHYQSVH